MTVSIAYVDDPNEEERQAILGPLVENNLRTGPAPNLRRFAFVIRNHHERTVGGLWGRTAYDWAVIELLFVPEEIRGAGIGRSLVAQVEELACERQCIGIWMDSFGFQAPGFYQKLGYEIFGALPDNPRGQSRYFLRRLLT